MEAKENHEKLLILIRHGERLDHLPIDSDER